MKVSLTKPVLPWRVVFRDESDGMLIVAIEPELADNGDLAVLLAELTAACLDSYLVQACCPVHAYALARIQHAEQKVWDDNFEPRFRAELAEQALRRAEHERLTARPWRPASSVPSLADAAPSLRAAVILRLTRDQHAETVRVVAACLRAGYKYRPSHMHHLAYDAYLSTLTDTALTAVYVHVGLTVSGRTAEADAVLLLQVLNATTTG